MYPISLGPLSILQVYRGLLIFLFICILFSQRARVFRRNRLIPITVIFFSVSLVIFCIKELADTDYLTLESINFYCKITYWLLLWLIVYLFCQDQSCRIILVGFVAGIIVTAICIYFGYFSGLGRIIVLEKKGILASAGAYSSAKSFVGTLVCGVVLIPYLWKKDYPWISAILTLALIGAIILTYNRSAQVSLAAVLIWMVFWRLVLAGKTLLSKYAMRLTMFLFLLGSIYFMNLGLTSLRTRWSDLQKPLNKIGSGRLLFYGVAWEHFSKAEPKDFLLGIGFMRLYSLFESKLGDPIHAHSDLFDMLVIGGVLGILLLCSLVATLCSELIAIPRSSTEFGAAGAIICVFLVMGLVTGQLYAVNTMFTYIGSVTCLNHIASAKRIMNNQTQ